MIDGRLPRHLPLLSTMLDQLGHPSAAELAAHLGYSVRTVKRWISADHAPLAAALALYWSTNHGIHNAQVTAENDARLYHSIAECHSRTADSLRRELARVLAVADFGAANAPLLNVTPAATLPPAPAVVHAMQSRIKKARTR